MINIWNKVIQRADRDLNRKDVVCELHFSTNDINRYKEYEDEKGNAIIYPLCKPVLNPQAIPCTFPNLPISLSTINLKKRKPPVERKPSVKKIKTYSKIVSFIF